MQDRSHRRPHPRIMHLVIWTAGCALGFAAYRGLLPWWLRMPSAKAKVIPFMATYNLAMGMVLGTILAGVGILAARRWREGEGLPSLPGHWLLIFGFAAALVDGVAIAVDRSLLSAWYPPGVYLSSYWVPFMLYRQPELAHLYSQAVGWGLGAVASLAFSWHLRRRLTWPWLAAFLAFVLVASILSGGAIFALIHLYRSGWAVPRMGLLFNPPLRRGHPALHHRDRGRPRPRCRTTVSDRWPASGGDRGVAWDRRGPALLCRPHPPICVKSDGVSPAGRAGAGAGSMRDRMDCPETAG